MKVHFSEAFLNDIFARIDMLEVMKKHGCRVKVGEGANHFYISDFCCGKQDFDNGRIKKQTQTYKCLSCGKGGNAIHFLREIVGLSFQDAVKELAEMVNMELPMPDPSYIQAQTRKNDALQLTVDFYQSQNNYEYFLSRGISLEVLKKAKAGYAPGGRVLRDYLEKQGFTKNELTEYKLINKKGLDRFFYRAILPVFMFGKVVDIYGRNTKDSGVKHLYLYGEDILGGYDNLEKGKILKIYESAIDRLVAESYGLDNGTDPGGATKFNREHVRLLKRKGIDKALIIYDGDDAGYKGALNTGAALSNDDIRVWVAELPEDKDPAQILVDSGIEHFLACINGPKTFQIFQMYHELRKYSLTDIEKYVENMRAESAASSEK